MDLVRYNCSKRANVIFGSVGGISMDEIKNETEPQIKFPIAAPFAIIWAVLQLVICLLRTPPRQITSTGGIEQSSR